MGYIFGAYLGIPWASRGSDRAVGLNCWELLRLWYREQLGIALPSYDEEYSDALDCRAVARAVERHLLDWVEVPRGSVRPSDVVLCNPDLGAYATHVGIYAGAFLGVPTMLHARPSAKSAIAKLDSLAWRDHVVGFYRHREAPQ